MPTAKSPTVFVLMHQNTECWHLWNSKELLRMERSNKKIKPAVAVLQQVPAGKRSRRMSRRECSNGTQMGRQIVCSSWKATRSRCPCTFESILCQQMMRRYQGIEDAGAVFLCQGSSCTGKSENNNQQGAKSTSPETDEFEKNEAIEANCGGERRKTRRAPSDG
jgi:hypothetical protein